MILRIFPAVFLAAAPLRAAVTGLGPLPVEVPLPPVAAVPPAPSLETEAASPAALSAAGLEAESLSAHEAGERLAAFHASQVRQIAGGERAGDPGLGWLFDGVKGRPAVEGLFGPDSMMWRINGHMMGRFGGFAALATQATHPLVAEASKVSRELLRRPHRRLLRTMVLIERVMFADRETALDAARQINRRHAEIEGRLEQDVGRFPAGTPFRAKDPELLKYVLATTHHFTRLYYETFVSRLSEEERDRYYREFAYFGRLLAVPRAYLPAARADFEAYLRDMFESDTLAAGPTARELSAAFLKQPKLPWGLGPVLDLPVRAAMRLVAGTLPERMRELNGLPWTLKDRLLFPLQLRAARLALAGIPDALLRTPAYYRAVLRVKLAPRP